MHCTYQRNGKICGAPSYQNPCPECVAFAIQAGQSAPNVEYDEDQQQAPSVIESQASLRIQEALFVGRQGIDALTNVLRDHGRLSSDALELALEAQNYLSRLALAATLAAKDGVQYIEDEDEEEGASETAEEALPALYPPLREQWQSALKIESEDAEQRAARYVLAYERKLSVMEVRQLCHEVLPQAQGPINIEWTASPEGHWETRFRAHFPLANAYGQPARLSDT